MSIGAWLTVAVGIIGLASVVVAAFMSKRPSNGNDKIIDLLKNDLRAILQKLTEGMVANGTKIDVNNTKIETMDRAVCSQLSTQTQSIDKVHERIDDLIQK